MMLWLTTRALSLALAVLLSCGSEGHSSAALCGNGALDLGESCDDGNRYDGDNCPSNCRGSATSFEVATNRCPAIESISVLPSQASVGGLVALSAQANDPEGDAIYYDWTATGGLLSKDANPKRCSYRCGFVGRQTVTLWVFDEEGCVATQQLTVVCR